MRRTRLLLWVDLALKALLFGLLALAVVAPDLPQFEGKAFTGRAIGYPVAVLLVPAVWWAFGRSRDWAYPYDVDILFTLPFLIDVLGNALDLYDSISWWDDLNHLVNWAILVAGAGRLLLRTTLPRLAVLGLAIGFGAVTAILWELAEYVTFIRHSDELATAYTDTLGDLTLGLTGSVVAATLTVTVFWPRPASMHQHPRIKGGFAMRFIALIVGLFIFALAIVLTLEAGLGLWPWDVLHQGIAHHTPLTFGEANIVVGIFILLVAWALGGPPGIGTIANATLIGLFIQGLTSIDWVTDLADQGLGVRIVLLAVGIALAGPGSAFYIGADLGAGPRDTLMLVGSRRLGRRVGIVRAAIELSALAVGIALGGDFGIGTIAFAVAVGPVVEAAFWLLGRSPIAVATDDREPVVIEGN